MKIKRVMTASESPVLSGSPIFVENGTEVCGKLSVEGDIRIDGQVEGSLRRRIRLVVGESGRIRAKRIGCASADIFGSVEGTLIVTGLLCIRSAGDSAKDN